MDILLEEIGKGRGLYCTVRIFGEYVDVLFGESIGIVWRECVVVRKHTT